MIVLILLLILLVVLFFGTMFIIKHSLPCKDCIYHDRCKKLEENGESNICTRSMLTGNTESQE